jgi:threonine dehydrogenase-like Zn-dependent dehydrogenase
LAFDAVVDATNAADMPAFAARRVEPGGRVVYIGIAEEASPVDSRDLVLRDVTAVGVLSASGGLSGTIELYATGVVDPRPLVAATVGLAEAADVLAGRRGVTWGSAPKVHVDPRR